MHPIFHVSMLQKYVPDKSRVVPLDLVELGPNLSFMEEPIAILDRQVWNHRPKEIALVKIQ